MDNMAMASYCQDLYLAFDSLDIFILYFRFVDDFDSYFLVGGQMHGEVHFAECPLSDVLA